MAPTASSEPQRPVLPELVATPARSRVSLVTLGYGDNPPDRLTVAAAISPETLPPSQNTRSRDGRKPHPKYFLFCFPWVKSRRVRSQVLTCFVSGLFLAMLLAVFPLTAKMKPRDPDLGLALTNHIARGEVTIMIILIILSATMFFCYSVVRLCVMVSRGDRARRRRLPEMMGLGGYVVPPKPIPVVLARDEEAAGIESETVNRRPPAYGLWRESVRVDPNRLFWQRNEAAEPALRRPETAASPRPPSYASDDGVSTLMLHREYFPFLPTPESEPRGPVDQPMLGAPAPEGWWDDSSRLLFGAAEHIAAILHEASECGVHLMTPFAGFCAFSAGYLNLYVAKYPRMNLGRSPRASDCLKMCLDYLEKFRLVWKIADGWGGTRKIKTIHHASVLYERATEDRTRYQGRTRADFDTLHQSVHEFRVVDRSDAHTREIRGAERPSAQATWPVQGHEHEHEHEHELDTNTLLNQLFAEVSNNLDEQGAWSQWWPAIDQVDL
ncbi:uncharacterized protein MAM_06945 [Metarhizium album ARSEF 1941]|uniref:Uncharacterized protein n=1 Tax=Metarhizium album (strain ARSEF 1941) TaxID=1081103 RepID=A0A0B2WNM8_METAS|nr:uncharacterized protein MAM_06945 [Metarhizium album ARSEF 1941]KHN95234.1 hypothetical protein MAM_06945 [Metarhizium album ARSEF 1941]